MTPPFKGQNPAAQLRRLVKGSPLLPSSRSASGALPFRTRALKPAEIAQLESQGCRSADWSRILVQDSFDPAPVRDSDFSGDVVLSRFSGTVMLPGRLSMPTGIHRCRVQDSFIGNACLMDTGLVADQIIHDAAAIFRVGLLAASGPSTFATGGIVSVGLETGGRAIPLFAEMDFDLATWLAFTPASDPERQEFDAALERHIAEIRTDRGVVGEGTVICNTAQIRNAWIGPGATIDGATLIRDAALLSTIDEPVLVRDGAMVEHAVLQAGCFVRAHAIVRRALFCQHSGATRHAKITHAILGPNTEVMEGEVTSSLIGPLVGFHHQSMLIAALWPEGRGNVGHGAALGSNHTGRLADQELIPGEGQFFGLCTEVKFPANFSAAPHTMLATGTITAPMRFALPFSLILPAESQSQPNPCKPGWMWLHNAYALERAEGKWLSRDKTRQKVCARQLLHLDLLEMVSAAREALRAASGKPSYGPGDIAGIGACRMSEKDRLQGIDAYGEILRLAAMRALLRGDDAALAKWASKFVASEFPGQSEEELLSHLPGMERLWVRRIISSRDRDHARGVEVIDDYAVYHPMAREDSVVKAAGARARETAKLVRERLGAAVAAK